MSTIEEFVRYSKTDETCGDFTIVLMDKDSRYDVMVLMPDAAGHAHPLHTIEVWHPRETFGGDLGPAKINFHSTNSAGLTAEAAAAVARALEIAVEEAEELTRMAGVS